MDQWPMQVAELETLAGTRSLPQLHRVHGPLSSEGRPPYAKSKWEARSMVDQGIRLYSALTHGLMSKWTYLSRTTPDIGQPQT